MGWKMQYSRKKCLMLNATAQFEENKVKTRKGREEMMGFANLEQQCSEGITNM
jgi:hypothetical protein